MSGSSEKYATTLARLKAKLKLYFDGEYSSFSHDHDGDYAVLGHGHAGLYQPADSRLSDLAGLSYAGNTGKVVAVNATEDGLELIAAGGGGGLSQQQVEGLI